MAVGLAPQDLPLAGTVVLDFSQFVAGPVAALRLADLGARVIKVERPVTGSMWDTGPTGSPRQRLAMTDCALR